MPTTTVPPAIVQPGASTTASGPASATTTTVRGAPSRPSTTQARATPLQPMVPGTYRYDTVGQSTIGTTTAPFPALTTFLADAPTGNRQHGTRDLRDPSGSGPLIDSTFEYRADGLYLVNLRTTISVLLFSVTGGLQPPSPVLLLPTGATPGYHRELDVPTDMSTAHLVLDVVRRESVTVAGRAVGTTVIRLVANLPGQYNARLDFTIWLAPDQRVWAREHLVADAAAAGVTYHSEYDATLQRLTPS